MFRVWDPRPLSEGDLWGDVRPFEERICDSIEVELAGKTPSFLTVWNPWPARFSEALKDIEKIRDAVGPTVVARIEWQLENGSAPGEEGFLTTADIASGAFDDYITRYARAIRRYGDPLFVRLMCGEFNGSWWKSCSPRANPKLTPQDFIAAWRRVVDIFGREGATNVAWIWIPNAFPPAPVEWADADIAAYYPGDDYVDWVGADVYDSGLVSWLDPLYAFALEHDKPFFLAEFGIRIAGSPLTHEEQVGWLEELFDYVSRHPQIKAISYFNYNFRSEDLPSPAERVYLYDRQVSYVPNVSDGDSRLLAGGEDVRALFAHWIADPRYISTLVIGAPSQGV